MSKDNDTVSFRLTPEFAKALAEEAAKRNESIGTCARRLLIAALSGDAHPEALREISDLRVEIVKVREEIATTALAFLVRIGKEDPDQARDWVVRNLCR